MKRKILRLLAACSLFALTIQGKSGQYAASEVLIVPASQITSAVQQKSNDETDVIQAASMTDVDCQRPVQMSKSSYGLLAWESEEALLEVVSDIVSEAINCQSGTTVAVKADDVGLQCGGELIVSVNYDEQRILINPKIPEKAAEEIIEILESLRSELVPLGYSYSLVAS